MMEFTAAQIAEFLHGTVDGDPSVKVSSLAKIEEGAHGTLSFLANPKYTQFIYSTGASVVVVNNTFIPSQPVPCVLIRVPDAYASFALLLDMFGNQASKHTGVSPKASIDESARLAETISVGDFTVIGKNAVVGKGTIIHPQVFIGEHVTIGENCVIYPGVRIYHACVVGNNCTLHSGVVIGSDGFGFAPAEGNLYKKIPQIGNVVLEDHVEIGSNSTIDRATMGSTIIRRGVKLDNLIQVAHNVEIGENTVIAAQTGISGSTKIGRNCMIGGQVGIVGHITIADNVKIGAGSGIEASILQEGATMLGAPAIEAGKARRNFIHWRNLDSIVRIVYALNKKMDTTHE